jgi:hypothetical protein
VGAKMGENSTFLSRSRVFISIVVGGLEVRVTAKNAAQIAAARRAAGVKSGRISPDQAAVRVAAQKVDLPLGYSVTFEWRGSLVTDWKPGKPLATRDARMAFSLTADRMLKAYREARRDYLQVVANVLGQAVCVIDTAGPMVVRPNRVH